MSGTKLDDHIVAPHVGLRQQSGSDEDWYLKHGAAGDEARAEGGLPRSALASMACHRGVALQVDYDNGPVLSMALNIQFSGAPFAANTT